MKRLRDKLVVVFLVATLAPLGATLYVGMKLLDQSLDAAPVKELDGMAASLEAAGKALYGNARQLLRERADAGRLQPEVMPSLRLEAGERERFFLDGQDLLLVRAEGVYRLRLEGVRLAQLQHDLGQARALVEAHRTRDLKRGFLLTLGLVVGLIWVVALGALVWLTDRVTRPIGRLTEALRAYGLGRKVEVKAEGADEVAQAVESFNEMTEQLGRNRERMLYLARLESWQSVGRKMAHEVKNSLTPIRLTVEEMVARSPEAEREFLEQASQIVTEEVQSLERRVKAFSEMASEPPVDERVVDLNALVEERIAFLRQAHPEVVYRKQLEPELWAAVDVDLVRGILTNLLENAAEAAGRGGVVRVATGKGAEILVEDSGPGLSLLARETLFQPTISFKRAGMGLGLSIAKRSAVVMGGDLELVTGTLGGAAFRLRLKEADKPWREESLLSMTRRTSAVPSV